MAVLAVERKQYIKDKLQREKRVIVADLAEYFDVTEETIRRDLVKLESEGIAQKIYGGAILSENSNIDLPYSVRRLSNVDEKQIIADIVEPMIAEGANIMLDASSTALFVTKALRSKNMLTVVTNSSEIIGELADKSSWRVFATGGLLKEGGYAFVGARAVESIKSFHVDVAIFSCKGIEMGNGLTDSNDNDAEIKKAIINAAKKKILVVDCSKFDRISLVEIGDFSNIDVVVTDKKPSDEWCDFFEEKGIELYY